MNFNLTGVSTHTTPRGVILLIVNLVPSFSAHSSLTASFTVTYNINHPNTVKAYKSTHIAFGDYGHCTMNSIEHVIGLYHRI